ncbi:MAG: branched-chain amino acid transaminase [Bdellovibrionales bacterium]|nr:branched-chain amino acid transaminase [Bdellovibrionales bacterium]
MFDDMPGFIWMDGQLMPWKDARIHIMTHALHYGSSVFEGVRSYRGKIFKGMEHCERLHASANMLAIKVPYTPFELLKAMELVLSKGQYQNAYIRMLVWCGSKVMTVSNRDIDIHVAIGMWERPLNYPRAYYEEGLKLKVASWRRPDPKSAPVASKAAGLYMISSMSKVDAEINGFNDALMLDLQGRIAEATSSNVFFVIDDILYTPPPECFLNGITRNTVIDLARSIGIGVKESPLTLVDLEKATEGFLTGTAIEILPIGSIEDRPFSWKFKPGPVTQKIRNAFLQMIETF